MDIRQKIRQDRRTIRMYERQMRQMKKEHSYIAEGYSTTNRRSRAACAGECVLQAIEKLCELQQQRLKENHPLIAGSCDWTVIEQKVKDTDGKKGFRYGIAFHVLSNEPMYTEDEIRAEMRDTYRKIRQETEEMFGKAAVEEYLAEDRPEDLVPPFEPDTEVQEDGI